MKKLILLFALLLPFGVFAQNGRTEVLVSPNSNSPHFLIDTVFTLGSILQDTTVVYLHYHNPTATNYAGFQVRFFYPTAAFKQPIIKWGPTATPIATKYGSYYTQPGWVNATAIYTGTSAVFDWPDGAVFEVLLPHAVGFNPSAVDSLEVQSTPSYTNIATTTAGLDNPLGVYNYGGRFKMDTLVFPVTLLNVDGTPAPDMPFAFDYKLKTAQVYSRGARFVTNNTGLASIKIPYDTSFYNVKLVSNLDTLSDNSAINITDAYRLSDMSIYADTAEAYEFQQGDVNRNNTLSVSDAYLIFNRLATGRTTWSPVVANEYNVRYYTAGEYATIMANPNIFQTATIGTTNIDVALNGLSSLSYRGYVLGDVTNTGLNNLSFQIQRVNNPTSGTSYVLDEGTIYQNIEDSVQFRIPKLTISDDNSVNVAVTFITHGNKVGAAQLSLKYDPTIFRFTNVNVGPEASAWNAFISAKPGEITWGGHESKMSPSLITNPTQMFNFQFEILNQNWEQSPIKITNKAAGNEKAEDLNIIPSPVDATVVNGRRARELVDQLVNGFRVYPNPVQDNLNIDYFQTDWGYLTYEIYDYMGKNFYSEKEFVNQNQVVTKKINVSDLKTGFYFVRLTTNEKQKVYKIFKF
jgi:Secretion system C-terminal sorting domain/Cohesin domain